MRPLTRAPDTDRRQILRVPAQPHVRVGRADYSIGPRFAGRQLELHVYEEHVTAVALDIGGLACRHPLRRYDRLTPA